MVPGFPGPSQSGFTHYADDDKWWSKIFASPHAEQGEDEDVIDYCNRVVAMVNNPTNVDETFLHYLVFYRVRNGLLQPIKNILNAQLDQPRTLDDLAQTALRIQRQFPTPRSSVSIANLGPVLQNFAPPRTIPQRGGRTPSAQRLTWFHQPEQERSYQLMAGREEVRESPSQSHRSEKRKSLHDHDEANLEQALLQKRHAGNAREEQTLSSMQGQVARRKNPQAYRDTLGGGLMGRQRCREEGSCYTCHSPDHMHQQCPLRPHPF